jgi:hypothetical protein
LAAAERLGAKLALLLRTQMRQHRRDPLVVGERIENQLPHAQGERLGERDSRRLARNSLALKIRLENEMARAYPRAHALEGDQTPELSVCVNRPTCLRAREHRVDEVFLRLRPEIITDLRPVPIGPRPHPRECLIGKRGFYLDRH